VLFYLTDLITLGCINGIMVVALNLQYGYCGLLNVALYSYVAVGAYVAAVTTMGHSTTPNVTYILGWTLPWYVGLLLGGLAAVAVGALIFSFSVRRLRSDYLAIVTVSTAFIIWNVINSLVPLFDGANGLFNVPPITGTAQISTEGYALVLGGLAAVLLAACVVCSRRIYRSPYGRVLRAIREDEVVAAAFGQRIWPAQLWVFLIGSFFAGIAGGLFVYYISAWSPSAFQPLESFILLAALMIGGSGNYWGALLGAFVVIEGLNEFSRFVPIPASVNQLAGAIRGIVIGVGLILVLRYRPAGLIPERRLRWYRASIQRWARKAPEGELS
jgi:branched-chain amino acid transport system permease protein